MRQTAVVAPSPAPAAAAAAAAAPVAPVAPGAKAAPAGTYTDIPISNVRRVGRHTHTQTGWSTHTHTHTGWSAQTASIRLIMNTNIQALWFG